jgi:hypothetical protein
MEAVFGIVTSASTSSSSSTTQSIHLSGAHLRAFNWGNAGGDPEAARASLLHPSFLFFFTYEVRVGYLGIFLSPYDLKVEGFGL